MFPSVFYNLDPFVVTAQVEEGGPVEPGGEFEPPQEYTVNEAIAYAGRNNQLIRLTYQKTEGQEEGIIKTYQIEVYSYRVRGGKLFLFAYDTDAGNIKGFRTDAIQNIQVLPEKFQPRWTVEL